MIGLCAALCACVAVQQDGALEAQRRVWDAWMAGDLYTARREALRESLARPEDALLAEYDGRLALVLSDAHGAQAAAARLRAAGGAPERLVALEQEAAALAAQDGDGERSVRLAKFACGALLLGAAALAVLALQPRRRTGPPTGAS